MNFKKNRRKCSPLLKFDKNISFSNAQEEALFMVQFYIFSSSN